MLTSIRWMGYGKQFQDSKCNVHILGKKGPGLDIVENWVSRLS